MAKDINDVKALKDVKKIHLTAALISILFGFISVIILITLKVQGVIVILPLWLLAPFLFKKVCDKLGGFLVNHRNT